MTTEGTDIDDRAAATLSPVSFLQAFITHSIKVPQQCCSGDEVSQQRHIEGVGLAASHCLEEQARTCLGLTGPVSPDEYADLIISIKNQIGGNFSRASSSPGTIRVLNTRCPFGENVKEAPELCRMTSSVFGGIAARNFGYGKIELRKRIALNDSCCEVLIHTEQALAQGKPGDEYQWLGDTIVSKSSSAQVLARVEAKLRKVWCHGDARTCGAGLRPTLVAESQAMRMALEAVEIVAPTRASVLVTGETGVGKEVIARAIHGLSDRAAQQLVAVNCGAIPENLIESALFGHEKGAFTDAYNVHRGFFERADGATLFLDEIDCLPIAAQARLLRVLQEGEFERVGGRQTLRANVRIVAASNQNLEQLVEQGKFRRDLYYRVNVIPIHVPPLRERSDDIAPLVQHFLTRLAARHAVPVKVLSDHAWMTVYAHSWPGNLRELENLLERAFLFARGPVIEDLDVPRSAVTTETRKSADASFRGLRQRAGREAEAKAIIEALERCKGNVSEVARLIHMSPRAVHMKLKSLEIDAAPFRSRRA